MRHPCNRIVTAFSTTFLLAVTLPGQSVAAPILFEATGAGVATEAADFRTALGIVQEIGWDGGGAATTISGTPLTAFQLTRGAVFDTPGTGFVQAPVDGLVTTFANPTYSTFPVFSPLRLFSAIGSNITDTTFTVPGDPATPAFVSGFGVVFSDVDTATSTSLQFFGPNGGSLGTFFADPLNDGLSFLGVLFDAGEQVARVRITSGNVAPGPNDSSTVDVVMMDNFIFDSPQAVPEPATIVLFGLAAAGALARRRLV